MGWPRAVPHIAGSRGSDGSHASAAGGTTTGSATLLGALRFENERAEVRRRVGTGAGTGAAAAVAPAKPAAAAAEPTTAKTETSWLQRKPPGSDSEDSN